MHTGVAIHCLIYRWSTKNPGSGVSGQLPMIHPYALTVLRTSGIPRVSLFVELAARRLLKPRVPHRNTWQVHNPYVSTLASFYNLLCGHTRYTTLPEGLNAHAHSSEHQSGRGFLYKLRAWKGDSWKFISLKFTIKSHWQPDTKWPTQEMTISFILDSSLSKYKDFRMSL